MSNEVKCTCQYCNGHITFPAEMAGKSINCPHCQLETLLFIPPVAVEHKRSLPTSKNNTMAVLLVILIIFVVCVIAAFFLKNSQKQTPLENASNSPKQATVEAAKTASSLPEQSNLKPVLGAFGWKLGDQLPLKFKAEVRESDYATILLFTPETEWPPFNSFSLDLTPDGRICAIQATAVIFNGDPGDFDTAKQRVVSLLTEKYGLRLHSRPGGTIEDEYEFGTADLSVRLQTLQSDNNKQLWLEYYDKNLKSIADDAHAAARAKDESNKKAALSKGL